MLCLRYDSIEQNEIMYLNRNKLTISLTIYLHLYTFKVAANMEIS